MKYIRMKYYDTYFYCNVIMNVINDINYVSTINQFFEGYFGAEEDADYYEFPRVTILHEFFEWVIDTIIHERMRNIIEITESAEHCTYDEIFSSYNSNEVLIIEEIMCRYNKKPIEFRKWWVNECNNYVGAQIDAYELLNKYIENNRMAYDDSVEKLSDEIFYLLFQNREFLLWFNETVASYNKQICNRKRLPEWVKRTIEHRDKGRCVFCGRDVVGTYETQDDYLEHFDHIVPLVANGINCVTNIQLACCDCNEGKHSNSMTNNIYVNWYDKFER